MKHRKKKKKTKKQTTFERIRAKVAHYIDKGHPIHEAEAMARHMFRKKK